MLNRFKNALYGSSGSNDDMAVVGDGYRDDTHESILRSRVRSALTRSSSFREELLHKGQRDRQLNSEANNFRSPPSSGNRPGDHGHNSSQYSKRNKDTVSQDTIHQNNGLKHLKYRYRRPEFLQLKTEDEIMVSADHQIRPIILPRDVSRLPWRAGYAECINAGKSRWNEDQATCYQGVAVPHNDTDDEEMSDHSPVPIYESIPWTYFAVFDGHAGPAVAIAAANQLHHIIADKLNSVAKRLIEAEKFDMTVKNLVEAISRSVVEELVTQEGFSDNSKDAVIKQDNNNPIRTNVPDAELRPVDCRDTSECDKPKTVAKYTHNATTPSKLNGSMGRRNRMIEPELSIDALISGVLESAFWEMDALVGSEKRQFKMPGGCTAIVSLFILGKLYVCNAGDSRAITILGNNSSPMSHDFTPVSERKRLARLGLQCPELLCDTFTQIEYYPEHPTKSKLGTKMLYRDAYMTGFAMKTITKDDLKYPLVCGEGKRSRLLATIGVTRGFGDHEMRSQYGSVPIKPFLTPEPAVMCLDIDKKGIDELTADDVLIIGTDGLWDVTTLDDARHTVKSSFEMFPEREESRSKYRYMTAAQDLIIQARGHCRNVGLWTLPFRTTSYASHDDITVFVVPLKPYKQEYEEWKRARYEAFVKANESKQLIPDRTLGAHVRES